MNRNYWASIFYDGSANFTKTVQEYEDRGLVGLEVRQVYGSPFVPLASAATVTKRVQLATGIAIGLTRSPFETAMTALDLDHLSQGRFILGLGTGPLLQERIEPLWQRANSMMIVPPSWGLSPERYAAKTAAIAETFWSTR